MLAEFQGSGKIPVLMELLKMLLTGSASTQAAAFSSLGGMLSGPQLFILLAELSTKSGKIPVLMDLLKMLRTGSACTQEAAYTILPSVVLSTK